MRIFEAFCWYVQAWFLDPAWQLPSSSSESIPELPGAIPPLRRVSAPDFVLEAHLAAGNSAVWHSRGNEPRTAGSSLKEVASGRSVFPGLSDNPAVGE